ncbi:MAG: valine--tRNA ligase [Psittacicella sp.]
MTQNINNNNNLEKVYNPNSIESKTYSFWENNSYFKTTITPNNKNFSIMLPPPNVTGTLHMGHAFQQTLMDILIRYHRMNSENTLWQGGSDHAGIATQMVVERKMIREQNKSRHEFSRDDFISEIWKWKEQSGQEIEKQMRCLGNSIDWERTRFTMDPGMSLAVSNAFSKLYDDKLIYKKRKLVNWDPKLKTAISDLEVENKEVDSFIWNLKYKLENSTTLEGKDYIIIATTRPETLFGDVCIAVNPEDERYLHLIGKNVIVPVANRAIPIVVDEHADKDFGTGCVKITPAHDFNDYEVGLRHKLDMVNILTLDADIRSIPELVDCNGILKENTNYFIPEKYQGLSREEARKEIVKELKSLDQLVSQDKHKNSVPTGDRSGSIIEPMLTEQWYLDVKDMAKDAIDAVETGNIEFIPSQYKNLYLSWMNNIHDWCISRQLWWGHRIPVWYDNEGNQYCASSKDELYTKYNLDKNIKLTQDEDVLDTWFSSGLWTFATLGWPENTDFLKTFHPSSVLVTGFDIIFFWVARMIMMSLHFIRDENGKKQVPFKKVYIHGLVRDENGQKMSKSKGNVIDPLDIINGISLEDLLAKRTANMMQPQLAEKIKINTKKAFKDGMQAYGTDALRFTLTALASQGRDIKWDINRVEGYRNFCNKLWNATRFILMNVDSKVEEIQYSNLDLIDKWIISQYNLAVGEMRKHLDNFRFDLSANTIYEFIWNQFCDWYLEFAKINLNSNNKDKIKSTKYTLIYVLNGILKLAHPIIPFITEEIWQSIKSLLPTEENVSSIMLSSYPEVNKNHIDLNINENFNFIKKLVSSLRNFRKDNEISGKLPLELYIPKLSNNLKECFNFNQDLIYKTSNLSSVNFESFTDKNSYLVLIDSIEVIIPLKGLIDPTKEKAKLELEITKTQKDIDFVNKKLLNENFVKKAPKEVLDKENAKMTLYKESLKKLQDKLEELSSN